jgi:WD40 repeat protein
VVVLALAAGPANGGSGASSSAAPILFAGGISTASVAGVRTIITLSSAELFEPNRGASGSFVATGPMNTARLYHSATLLKDGRVLVAGGSSDISAAATIFASAELYDRSKRQFSNTGAMLDARTGHTATLLADGKVLIAGGDDGTTSLSSSELYDPVSGEFSDTGAMNIPRDNCTATLLANGKVLIAGGFQLLPDFSGNALNTAELYDPATGSFSMTGTMTSAREFHTATLLPDGRVLITGGGDNNGNGADTAELYDPTTGQFSSAGKMTTSRYVHLAAALGDGDVLLAGGIDNRGASLKSAEVFVARSGKFVKVAAMPRDRFLVGASRSLQQRDSNRRRLHSVPFGLRFVLREAGKDRADFRSQNQYVPFDSADDVAARLVRLGDALARRALESIATARSQ